jgi:hypothetical protein
MNAAGGGTNRPKMMGGKTYAAGGGMVGNIPQDDKKERVVDPILEKGKKIITSQLQAQKTLSAGRGSIGQIEDLRKRLIDIYKWFSSQGINIQDPKTWAGIGGRFKMPGAPAGEFKMPDIGGIKIPGEFGGGTIGDLGKQVSNKIGQSTSEIQKYIQDTFDKVKSDPNVQNVSKAIGEIQKKLIKDGYLNKEGKLSGAAKNQATNFLSDLLPNLPFVNDMNKMKTESYLRSIGISKENAKYGDLAAQAMITGKSGIESAYNIGQMQLNKMSKESKKIYLDILKEKMASGTLKSGDVINPYGKVDKSDPRYREQGNVRFYVDPKTGKGYLLDTYGFDPGKINLGGPGSAAQRQYEKQVKSFQDPNKKIKLGLFDIPIGQIAKKLDLRPMQDATEGGQLPQYILALRNKLFGYDAQKEGAKLDPKRFKSKAQIDELKELGDLKKFAAQLSPQQKKLVDEKLKKAESDEMERQKRIKESESAALSGQYGKYAAPSQQVKFARPRNVGVKPPGPPVKRIRTKADLIGTGGYSGGKGGKASSPTVPSISSTHPKSDSRRQSLATLGVK